MPNDEQSRDPPLAAQVPRPARREKEINIEFEK